MKIFTVKIFPPIDARAQFEDLQANKVDEVNGLINRRIWTTAKEVEVPSEAKKMGYRLLLTLKNCGEPGEKVKFMNVAEGYKYHEKTYLVH